MSVCDLDDLVKQFNTLIYKTEVGRRYRIMNFRRCIVYYFDDAAGIKNNEEHEMMFKRLAKATGVRATILDISMCKTANSTALGYWADIITQVKINGGRMLMIKPNTLIMKSLKMVGLEGLCELFDNLEQAVAEIDKAPNQAVKPSP